MAAPGNHKKQGIYISLDALLDTRMPLLSEIPGVELDKVLENGYFERRAETFFGVDKQVYDEAWANRDERVLIGALVSRTIGFINELVIKLNSEAKVTPHHIGPKIILNTYPYVLAESEIEAIVAGLAVATKQASDVEAVHMTKEELTPEWCKENVAIMFMYDEYASWLDVQAEAFSKNRCTEVSLIVPGIYFIREPTKTELAEAIRTRMHPLREVELFTSVFINLRFQDIELFCANIPIKKKTA